VGAATTVSITKARASPSLTDVGPLQPSTSSIAPPGSAAEEVEGDDDPTRMRRSTSRANPAVVRVVWPHRATRSQGPHSDVVVKDIPLSPFVPL
jgi:hypothetical protein